MSEVDLGATAFWLLLGAGVLSGLASVWIFRRFSDPVKLRVTSNRLIAHLLEFRLFADEPALILRAQRDLIAATGQMLRQTAIPSLIVALPFAVLLAGADAFFGHAALKPGEATVLTVQSRRGPSAVLLPGIELQAPAGMKVETPAVRVPTKREISWRLRPARGSSGELRVLYAGRAIGKTVCAKPGLHWLSERRTHVAEALLHPLELPFQDLAIDSIALRYPAATVLGVPWLAWFLLGSGLGSVGFLFCGTLRGGGLSR